MKIAYIVLKGMPIGGGIENYTEEIGSRLVERGHEVVVYTMRHYGNTKDDYYKGMKIITVPTVKTKSLEKVVASLIATLKHIFTEKADVVHFHAFGPAMFCLLPRILGRKVVVQGHGIEWQRSRWGLGGKLFLKLVEIPSVCFPHLVTVVSKTQQKYLKKRYGIKSVYIPTGVSPPIKELPDIIKKKYGLNKQDYILFAGRLVREKGVHYLIEAYNRLKTSIKLVIAGDALYEEKYKQELYRLAKGNKNIIFTGFITGKLLRELFSNCYLFILPSELEGLPTALLEAMSYGNCCLASDIPENIEVLDQYGYSFKNKDVDDLCEKLNFLLQNKNAIESVKQKAREYVLKNFSWDKIAESFAESFQQLYYNLFKRSKNGD